jgi:hypothetical protein
VDDGLSLVFRVRGTDVVAGHLDNVPDHVQSRDVRSRALAHESNHDCDNGCSTALQSLVSEGPKYSGDLRRNLAYMSFRCLHRGSYRTGAQKRHRFRVQNFDE